MASEPQSLKDRIEGLFSAGHLSQDEHDAILANVESGGQAAAEPSPSVSASSAPQELPAQVQAPGKDQSGGVVATPVEKSAEPGTSLGDAAPSLADLQNQLCPNCHTGVLYVTRYDPAALHEAGQEVWVQNQPVSLPAGWESGGAYDVRCFACEWTHSIAMNPGDRHGQAR